MDSIKIHTERPVLEINSTPARMHISTPKPTMRIKNPRPVMRVRRKAPRFKIVNQRIIQSTTGNPFPEQAMLRYRDRANQLTMKAIGETAQKYERLMHTDRGEHISTIMKDKMKKELPEVNVGVVPSEKPQLEWENGELIIDWDTNDVVIEWDGTGRPQIEVEPHSVEVRIRNHPSVKIYVTKNKRNKDVGGKVDRQV